jgi:BTB/POZ domain-containing protein KCTD8/12/16
MTNETNHLDVVELNVGGVTYATTLGTLQQAEPESQLAIISTMNAAEIRTIFGRDSKNRIFIDRDGVLFRYILDYLRNKKLSLPENFAERDRLRVEAEFYRLNNMSRALTQTRPNTAANGNLVL